MRVFIETESMLFWVGTPKYAGLAANRKILTDTGRSTMVSIHWLGRSLPGSNRLSREARRFDATLWWSIPLPQIDTNVNRESGQGTTKLQGRHDQCLDTHYCNGSSEFILNQIDNQLPHDWYCTNNQFIRSFIHSFIDHNNRWYNIFFESSDCMCSKRLRKTLFMTLSSNAFEGSMIQTRLPCS